MSKDKLHIIECKTSSITATTGAAILYKLDSIRRYGGSMTKTCLVSYYPLPSSVESRAKNLNIEVISGLRLKNLEHHIKNWIGKN